MADVISTLPMSGLQKTQPITAPDIKVESDGLELPTESEADHKTSLHEPGANSGTRKVEGYGAALQPSMPGKKRPALPNGQEGYAKKLRRIKLVIKNTIFVNAAICDEVLRTEEKLAKAKEERRFLLRKLLQHQNVNEPSGATIKSEQQASGKQSKDNSNETGAKPSKAVKRKNPASSTSTAVPTPSSSMSSSSLTALTTSSLSSPMPPGLTATGIPSLPGASASSVGESKKKQAAKDIIGNLTVKPKKGKGVNKKVIPPLMLDSLGRPVFPMVLGDITLHSIGEIVLDRPSFHSPEAIYPAGYCTTRVYGSLHKLDSSCLWTCKISESDDGSSPVFEIAAEDSSDIVFRASTPTECHALLLRAFNKSRGIPLASTDTSGLDFFGLSHPVIQNLVQSCPGARKCPRYKWVKFEINKAETNENVSVGVTDPSVGMEAFKAQLIACLKPSARSSQVEQSTNLRSLLTKGHSGGTL